MTQIGRETAFIQPDSNDPGICGIRRHFVFAFRFRLIHAYDTPQWNYWINRISVVTDECGRVTATPFLLGYRFRLCGS